MLRVILISAKPTNNNAKCALPFFLAFPSQFYLRKRSLINYNQVNVQWSPIAREKNGTEKTVYCQFFFSPLNFGLFFFLNERKKNSHVQLSQCATRLSVAKLIDNRINVMPLLWEMICEFIFLAFVSYFKHAIDKTRWCAGQKLLAFNSSVKWHDINDWITLAARVHPDFKSVVVSFLLNGFVCFIGVFCFFGWVAEWDMRFSG